MKKYLLLCTALVVVSPAYAEINCAKTPSCEELGYTKNASYCTGQYALKCPFDTAKMFCQSCEERGYTTIVVFCGEIGGNVSATCPGDSSMTRCEYKSAAEAFGCSETKKYFNGTTCSSSPTGAIGCYVPATGGIVYTNVTYAGGSYSSTASSCKTRTNNPGLMASYVEMKALRDCNLTPSSGSYYFVRDGGSSTCFQFNGNAGSCSGAYALCTGFNFD